MTVYPGSEIETVVIQMRKVVGYVPDGIIDTLLCLVHPDMIDSMQALLDSRKPIQKKETS